MGGRGNRFMDNRENYQALTGRPSRLRRVVLVVAGVGLGSAVAYLLSKVISGSRDGAGRRQVPDHIVDDRGTGQDKAAKILRKLRDRAFEASDEKLALALGRPVEEIAAWNAGIEVIDDDVVMKARGIAITRGVHVE
jgi:hypothetical protein